MTTIVSKSNEVKIPSDIAVEFDIRPGTRMKWSKSGEGTITLQPLPNRGEIARQLMGSGRRWLPPNSHPVAELIRDRSHDDQLDQIDEQQ